MSAPYRTSVSVASGRGFCCAWDVVANDSAAAAAAANFMGIRMEVSWCWKRGWRRPSGVQGPIHQCISAAPEEGNLRYDTPAVPLQTLVRRQDGDHARIVGFQAGLFALGLGQVEKEDVGALAPGPDIPLERTGIVQRHP